MQQAETFLSQKVNFFFPLSFTVYWKSHRFHGCTARAAHSSGAFIVTELLEGGVTLLPPLCVRQILSSEAGAFQLSDLPKITQTSLPQRGPELGPPKVVYM